MSVGERVLVCPSRELAVVKGVAIEESSKQIIFAGDQASVTLSGIEMQNVAVGFILSDPANPVQISSKFQAKIVVFNVTVPITKGFSVSFLFSRSSFFILFYFAGNLTSSITGRTGGG